MSQDETYTAVIIGIASDVSKVVSIWEAFRKLFLDYADKVIEALTSVDEAMSIPLPFGIDEPYLSDEKLEDLFKQMDENSIILTGTSPKEYGMSRQKHPRKATIHYNYIPRIPRNLPYQRRAYREKVNYVR